MAEIHLSLISIHWTLFCSLEQSRINIYLSCKWQIVRVFPLTVLCMIIISLIPSSQTRTLCLVLCWAHSPRPSKTLCYWSLLYYVGFLPLNEPTSQDLEFILLLIEPCDIWFKLYPQPIPLYSFHMSQNFILIDFTLLFDFGFSPICSLKHNQHLSSHKEELLKKSPAIGLPSHINCFLFYFHSVLSM